MRAAKIKGFTLIEVAITAAIIALLATIVLPMAEVTIQRGKEQELRTALRQIREALDAYKRAGDEGHILRSPGDSGYPPSLQTLVDGVQDAKNPDVNKAKLYFLRRIPRDPLAENSLSPEQTWGKRDYASTATQPEEGKDVFDVYSKVSGAGLNGVPYRDW